MVSRKTGIFHLNLSSTSEKSYFLSENYDIMYYVYFVKKKKYLRLVRNHIPKYIDGNEFFAV